MTDQAAVIRHRGKGVRQRAEGGGQALRPVVVTATLDKHRTLRVGSLEISFTGGVIHVQVGGMAVVDLTPIGYPCDCVAMETASRAPHFPEIIWQSVVPEDDSPLVKLGPGGDYVHNVRPSDLSPKGSEIAAGAA